jgi:hypothetical protein
MRGVEECNFEKDHFVDFVIHDRQSQHVKIVLYPEEHSKLWGYYAGEALMTGIFHIETFIAQGVAQFNVRPDEYDSSVAVMQRSDVYAGDSFKIHVCAEWGKISRSEKQAGALSIGSSLYDGFMRPGACLEDTESKDIAAILQVGLRKANHLEQQSASYWCVTTVAQTGAAELDKSVGQDASTEFTSSRVQGNYRPRKSATDGSSEFVGVEATWNASYFVPLRKPHLADLEVTVHSDDGVLGSVRYNVSELLTKPGLHDEIEDVLANTDDRKSNSEGDKKLEPCMHVMLRIFVLEAGARNSARPALISNTEQASPRTQESEYYSSDEEYSFTTYITEVVCQRF